MVVIDKRLLELSVGGGAQGKPLPSVEPQAGGLDNDVASHSSNRAPVNRDGQSGCISMKMSHQAYDFYLAWAILTSGHLVIALKFCGLLLFRYVSIRSTG